jgi:hypothetical protein
LFVQGDEFGAQATQFEFEFGLGGACQHAVGEVALGAATDSIAGE